MQSLLIQVSLDIALVKSQSDTSLIDVITYYTTIMGILRAGYVCFPISPRNSPTAVAHLLSKTSAAHIIVGREKTYQDLVSAALVSLKEDFAESSGAAGIPFSSMPLFEDLYLSDWQSNPTVPPPYGEPTLEDICMVVHSSGESISLYLISSGSF